MNANCTGTLCKMVYGCSNDTLRAFIQENVYLVHRQYICYHRFKLIDVTNFHSSVTWDRLRCIIGKQKLNVYFLILRLMQL